MVKRQVLDIGIYPWISQMSLHQQCTESSVCGGAESIHILLCFFHADTQTQGPYLWKTVMEKIPTTTAAITVLITIIKEYLF